MFHRSVLLRYWWKEKITGNVRALAGLQSRRTTIYTPGPEMRELSHND